MNVFLKFITSYMSDMKLQIKSDGGVKSWKERKK